MATSKSDDMIDASGGGGGAPTAAAAAAASGDVASAGPPPSPPPPPVPVGAPRLVIGLYGLTATEASVAMAAAGAGGGITCVDTAALYRNESAVGDAPPPPGASRWTITTKLHPGCHGAERAAPAISASLAATRRTTAVPLDVFMIHNPAGWRLHPRDARGALMAAWRAMEGAVAEGTITALGICNVDAAGLADVCSWAAVRPAWLQVEWNPVYRPSPELLAVATANGVSVEAHTPLGGGDAAALLANPCVARAAALCAATVGEPVTPAQAVLAWLALEGVHSIVVRTTSPRHAAEARAAVTVIADTIRADPHVAAALQRSLAPLHAAASPVPARSFKPGTLPLPPPTSPPPYE